jgi:hypothetical protein
MSDLIWVGNTLIPRGLVIAAVGLIFLAPFVIAGIIQLILKLKRRSNKHQTPGA